MLQITASTRIFICLSAVDFRKGIDGLSAVCRNQLLKDPLNGAMFVFRNKKRCPFLERACLRIFSKEIAALTYNFSHEFRREIEKNRGTV